MQRGQSHLRIQHAGPWDLEECCIVQLGFDRAAGSWLMLSQHTFLAGCTEALPGAAEWLPGRNRKVSIQARLVAQRAAHSQVIVLVMKASMTSMYTYSWHLALGLCKRGERKHTSLMEDPMPDDRGDSLASPLLRLKPSPDQEEHVRSARFSVVFAWNSFAMERYWLFLFLRH